jgi:hypothetical protein
MNESRAHSNTPQTYQATVLPRKGGREVLQLKTFPIEEPGPLQLRVRVLAAGVGGTDLSMLAGNYLYAPKMPLVPGYEVAGVVDALGSGVTGFALGQRVAALTVYGGFGQMPLREAEHFVPIPDGVSDVWKQLRSILNYVTAWQMIHRIAKVQPGQTALVTGAAGGVGTALLQPLHLAGARTYGAASLMKHGMVGKLGATPIDYRSGGMDRLTRVLEPQGRGLRFRWGWGCEHRAQYRGSPARWNGSWLWLHGSSWHDGYAELLSGQVPCPRHVHPVRAASWNCCDRYPCHSISAASSENSTSLVVAVGVICRGAKLFIRLLQQILGFRCMAVHIKLIRLLGG